MKNLSLVFSFIFLSPIAPAQDKTVNPSNFDTLSNAKTFPVTTYLSKGNYVHLAQGQENSSLSLGARNIFIKATKGVSIDPHADLRAKWPEITAKVADLQRIQSQISNQEGDIISLNQELYDELQRIGPYLEDVISPPSVSLNERIYTDAQLEESRSVMNRIYDTVPAKKNQDSAGDDQRLRITGLKDRFTLLCLNVPISISGPPKSTIYFECEKGGHFASSGLSVKEVMTDESGLASVQWKSTGDSAKEANLSVISSETVNSLDIPIKVVTLKLHIPDGFTP